MDGRVAVKKWKTNSSGQDLLLEGGRPVEIKPERVKVNKEDNAANKDCYCAVWEEGEQESDGSESSDERHDDPSGDEADNVDDIDEAGTDSGSSESSSEENGLDFNRGFSSATLKPGPSQRELQHAKGLERATNEKEKEKAESLRVRASWGLLQGESIRVLDYKEDQEMWAKSARSGGKSVETRGHSSRYVRTSQVDYRN